MLPASWKKNDKKANWLILVFSAVVFSAVVLLGRIQLEINPGFNVHLFAKANAIINSLVAICLLAALVAVKRKKYQWHRNIMITAMILSVLFLLSYICHHLLAGETRFGDADHNGILSALEKETVGNRRLIYFMILITHIPLAGIILPFILFSAYRGLTGDFARHKKLARITWPVWFYVAITGVIVYLMISPYYS